MDNEFTRRLNAQGNSALGKYLEAIFHAIEELKDQIIELKKEVKAKNK